MSPSGEMADAYGLGPYGETRRGSNPLLGSKAFSKQNKFLLYFSGEP